MPLELDSLKKAVAALQGVLAKSQDAQLMRQLDDVTCYAIKSGVILNCEFTYELCWKFIKRWLETNVSPTIAEGATRRQLFRLAAEYRLIHDVEQWMRYHEARNITSHTYEVQTAEQVYTVAAEFARDAQALLNALEQRND